jgi:hypothetical protein
MENYAAVTEELGPSFSPNVNIPRTSFAEVAK